jgi:hypothetical protein
VSGLTSKPLGRFSPACPQNLWRRVTRFGAQNRQLQFGDLSFKITVMVSWFVPQNQAGFGLSVAPQNRWREDGAGHASRSVGLLHLEASHARVSQSSLKTGRGKTAGWYTRHHRGGCVGIKLKMDGSMRRAASDPATLTLSFSMY